MRISLFDNQWEAIKELPDDRQGAFLRAFCAYVFDDVEPQFSEPMERMAWNLVLPYIEKSKTAVENGKKGGRKPKSETKQKPNSRNQAEKPNLETKPGKQAEKATLSENENERERLEESLKDSLTLSPASAGADAEVSAPRPGGIPSKAAADMQAIRTNSAQMAAGAVACPDYLQNPFGGAS